MEMTYDGTLVMPSSYVAMEQDEMSYVEGGLLIKHLTESDCNRWAARIAITGAIITTVAACATLISTVATICTGGTASPAVAISIALMGIAGGTTGAVSGYLWLASSYKGLDVNWNPIWGLSFNIVK